MVCPACSERGDSLLARVNPTPLTAAETVLVTTDALEPLFKVAALEMVPVAPVLTRTNIQTCPRVSAAEAGSVQVTPEPAAVPPEV
jgi:hypothetical protein